MKATIELANGSMVTIEGEPEEVNALLQFYDRSGDEVGAGSEDKRRTKVEEAAEKNKPDLAAIVNKIKTVENSQQIEKTIIRSDGQLKRTLLPLWINRKYFEDTLGLTSGDINKITSDLGTELSVQQASRVFANSGSMYVTGDRIRKKGVAVRYQLNDRGVEYLEQIINGETGD